MTELGLQVCPHIFFLTEYNVSEVIFMIEAVWYGLIAASAFIGFVSFICFSVLNLHKPENSRYIIIISENSTCREAEHLLCGAYLRRLIFGNLIFDEMTVEYCGADENVRDTVNRLSSEYGLETVSGKEKDGSRAH